MRPHSVSSLPRRSLFLRALAAPAVLALTALGSPSATAQILGRVIQPGSAGAPNQSAPVANQPPINRIAPGSVLHAPQPNFPSNFPSGSSRFYSNPPPVFGGSSFGNGFRGYGPSQSFPGQSPSFGSGGYQNQNVAPDVHYYNMPSPGSRSGFGSDLRTDTNQGLHGSYSPQLLRPRMPVSTSTQPGSIRVHRYYGPGSNGGDRPVNITTSNGQRSLHSRDYGNNYIYSPVTIVDGPSLLGGYYYGNYSDTYYASGPCYPSIYSFYPGFPEYIVNPGVIVVSDPYYPSYATPYQPFDAPTYQVTYNQYNYYVADTERAQQIQDGGETARRALKSAYPDDSYQAAFADIQQAWKNGDIGLLNKHIRDSDTTLSIYFKGKYSYSIASSDFVKITRDAFDRLSTVSFEFTRLRKAKNGDVTAYGKHVYQTSGGSDSSGDSVGLDNTVPFSADGSQTGDTAQPYDKADDPAAGADKTIYVSYTLRKHDDQWTIIGVDSSPTNLVK